MRRIVIGFAGCGSQGSVVIIRILVVVTSRRTLAFAQELQTLHSSSTICSSSSVIRSQQKETTPIPQTGIPKDGRRLVVTEQGIFGQQVFHAIRIGYQRCHIVMWECHWLRQRSARHGKGKQLDKNEALQSVNQIKPNKPGFHLAANEFGSIVDTLALFLVPREAPLTIAQFLKSVNRTLWLERNFLSVQMDERLPNWPKKDRRLVTDVVRVDCELEMWSVIIKSQAMSNYGS